MDGWRECKLGDVLNLKRGYDLPHQQRSPGPVPIISSAGVSGHHNEAKVKGPGVVTGRYGTLGEVFFVEEDFWPLNTSLYVQDFKGNDERFVVYFLRQLNFGSRNAAGAVPGVNRNHLHAIQVRVPPLRVQRRIAEILAAYDDLIENCERRIKVLDDMARAIYREWFQERRYPGAGRGTGAGEAGLLARWRKVPLAALAAGVSHAINGGPFGSKLVTRDYVDAGVPVIRGSNLTETGRFLANDFVFVSPEKARELSANLAHPGDIVVTQRGTLGQVAIVPAHTGFTEFVVSQSQMKATLDPAKVDLEYAYYYLSSPEAVQSLKNRASSSGVPHINLATLREFEVEVPPLPLQNAFATMVRPMRASQEALERRNRLLQRASDLLLPRLLSGQLAVAEAA